MATSKNHTEIQSFRRFLNICPEEINTIYKGSDGDEVMESRNYQNKNLEKVWPIVREIALNFNSRFRVVSEHMGIYEINHNGTLLIVYLK